MLHWKRLCWLIVLCISCVSCGGGSGGDGSSAGPTPSIIISGAGLQDAISVLEIGQYAQLSATTVDAVDSSYSWQSNNPAVVSVSTSGTVQALQYGVMTISVVGNDSGVTAQCEIMVIAYNPNLALWQASKHAGITNPAFTHWNSAQQIPVQCAKCHSTPGFLDYIGADASPSLSVDSPAIIGTVVTCETCHNAVAEDLDNVVFASGKIVSNSGADSVCLICHQGNSDSGAVDAAILASGVADDVIDSNLSFVDVHNGPAGALTYGGLIRGGYQYPTQVYDIRYNHVDGFSACVDCHDPHSLDVDINRCAICHPDSANLRAIRVLQTSRVDYDGDTNIDEGVFYEIDTLKVQLLASITAYVGETAGADICYAPDLGPYYFVDLDTSGSCEANETVPTNSYSAWTPRLLRAAYNYHYLSIDMGSYAHNAKYAIQLLYDSIADLDSVLATPAVSLAGLTRTDTGHLNGASEAARHWDADVDVSGTCARCHGGRPGYDFFQTYEVETAIEPQNGLECNSCHASADPSDTINTVYKIILPDGTIFDSRNNITNLCANCHIGRESKSTLDEDINNANGNYSFTNPHYLVSAAVYLGAEIAGGYEYDGQIYAQSRESASHPYCQNCHVPQGALEHSMRADQQLTYCTSCHSTLGPIDEFRVTRLLDYDGDADTAEPLKDELITLSDALFMEIQATATASGTPICFTPSTYPYFFKDTNQDGLCGTSEANHANQFKGWTPQLMKATYNYKFWIGDAGAWAHNFDYMAELLIDSIDDLGGDTSTFIRP